MSVDNIKLGTFVKRQKQKSVGVVIEFVCGGADV